MVRRQRRQWSSQSGQFCDPDATASQDPVPSCRATPPPHIIGESEKMMEKSRMNEGMKGADDDLRRVFERARGIIERRGVVVSE